MLDFGWIFMGLGRILGVFWEGFWESLGGVGEGFGRIWELLGTYWEGFGDLERAGTDSRNL